MLGDKSCLFCEWSGDFFPSYLVFQLFLWVFLFLQDGRVGREVKGVCVCVCVWVWFHLSELFELSLLWVSVLFCLLVSSATFPPSSVISALDKGGFQFPSELAGILSCCSVSLSKWNINIDAVQGVTFHCNGTWYLSLSAQSRAGLSVGKILLTTAHLCKPSIPCPVCAKPTMQIGWWFKAFFSTGCSVNCTQLGVMLHAGYIWQVMVVADSKRSLIFAVVGDTDSGRALFSRLSLMVKGRLMNLRTAKELIFTATPDGERANFLWTSEWQLKHNTDPLTQTVLTNWNFT